MIREVCSCSAEFETDDRDAIELVKSWRRTHKHEVKQEQREVTTLTNTDIALGFKAMALPVDDDDE
jgi:transcriptional regulator of acetoin/glycerol metabolism